MYAEAAVMEKEEGLEAEKNFVTEKMEDEYFVSNYRIKDDGEVYDVVLSEEQADYLEEASEETVDYDIFAGEKKLGELFEEGFEADMYSTLITSENDDIDVIQMDEKVLDSEEGYFSREAYDVGRSDFYAPNKTGENWRGRKGDKYSGAEWSLKGINWPLIIDIIEKENISSFDELSEVEINYNQIVLR